MSKLQKRSLKIEDHQIRNLIELRDKHNMSQTSLYEKIGQLIGRSVKHLRNLRNHEAAIAIDELPKKVAEIPKVIELPKPLAPLPLEDVLPIFVEEKIEEPKKKLSFAEILEKNRKEKNGNA